MSHPSILPATQADIPQINRLVNGAYRGDSSRTGWTIEADLLDGTRTDEDMLTEMLLTPGAVILKYEAEGKLLGCVYIEKTGASLYLGMLTVAPADQSRGIGKQLLSAAEQMAREQHCRSVRMTVISQRHELVAFYERQGYHSTGESKPFPDDIRFGLPKATLSLTVLEKMIEP